MSDAERLRRRLTARYVFALTLIALLAVVGQALVQVSLHAQHADGREINLAGRQRMLSQRIAKHAYAADRGDATARERLRSDVREWEEVHRGLLDGGTSHDLSGLSNPETYAALDALTDEVSAVVSASEALLEAPVGADVEAPLAALSEAERAFLPAMDRVVFALEAEARDGIRMLQGIEILLLIVVLVTLVLEARFVFRPAVDTAVDQLRRATRHLPSTDDLEGANVSPLPIFRMLLTAGAVMIPVFWVGNRIFSPGAYDPLWARLVVSGMCIGVLAMTYASERVRRYVFEVGVGATSLVVAYFAWICTWNGLDAVWGIGLVCCYTCCALVPALYARRVAEVIVPVAGQTAIVAGFLLLGPPTVIPVPLFIGYMLVFGLVVALSGMARLGPIQSLRESWDAAKEQGQMLRTVIDAIPDMIFVTDREGRCSLRNLADARGIGYEDPADTLGLTVFDTVDAARAQALYDADQAVMDSGEARYTDEAIRIDGEDRVYRAAKVPLRSDDGEVVGLVGIVRDVTQELQAQAEIVAAREAADEQRRMLRTIIDTIPDHVYVKDTEGRAILRNLASARALGYDDPAQALGRTDADANEQAGRDILSDDLRVVRDGQIIRNKEEQIVSGEWLLTTKVPLRDEGGRITGLVGVSRDITEAKAAEAELVAARDAAEAATRAKSEFLANMSHEIRTPMNGVIGMTSLLLHTDLDREQHDFVETIRTSGDALLTIINDILDFSKIEAGMLDLEDHPFDVRQTVESALDLVAQSAADKEIELAYIIDEGVSASVRGDVTRVRQVLVNLLSNAIKFTHEGSVCVRVSAQPPDAETGAQVALAFAVEDTGIGIPADKLEAIFESFSQADTSTTRQFGGTGLGLAICERLVAMMGGEISVESVEGAGSTFRFTTSVEVAPSERRVFLRAEQPALEGRRVLIIDDNAVNREILERLAARWNMEPQSASGGREGLARLAQAASVGAPFDLVLLDMQMPEMDGVAVAKAIHQAPDPPVVVMLTSINRDASLRERAEAAGVHSVLYKPTKPSQLYDALIEAFGDRPVAAPSGPTAWVARPRAEASNGAEDASVRVLLAEDNLVNQKVALRMLERLGYRADVVANGVEAVEAVTLQASAGHGYAIVFMDIQMPEMDGLEATRRIRSAAIEQPTIVALTANAMEGDREVCLAAGADDYVAKPVGMQALADAIERALGAPSVSEAVD